MVQKTRNNQNNFICMKLNKEDKNQNILSTAFMNRIPLYLNYLETIDGQNIESISATKISKALGLGEVLVRKELGKISGNGKPKFGYTVKGLINDIWKFLNAKKNTNAIIMGAGSLGTALMGHNEFAKFGINIIAGFDVDEKKIDNKKIYPVSRLKAFVKKYNVKIGILAVNEYSAATAFEELIMANVKGIWNFTPIVFNNKNNIIVKNENLALSAAYLNILIDEEELQQTKK